MGLSLSLSASTNPRADLGSLSRIYISVVTHITSLLHYSRATAYPVDTPRDVFDDVFDDDLDTFRSQREAYVLVHSAA